MQITPFPEHIFRQYKPDADLPDMLVLESLLSYGDLHDILKIHMTDSFKPLTADQHLLVNCHPRVLNFDQIDTGWNTPYVKA